MPGGLLSLPFCHDSAMKPKDPDALPDLGDEFEVVRPLGRGKMARVYLARERALKRLVAVKVLVDEWAWDPVSRQRFEREARAAARLIHPNIVSIYRVAQLSDETPYLVMEYIDGRNLSDVAASGSIDQETAVQVLLQLARGLATAHEHGVVHRDVRPDNVGWVPAQKRAVLMDFGIAALLESGTETVTRLTAAGEILGDPRYSSPEQLLGDPLTGRADIYSLAVVGYELISGELPFEATTKTSMSMAHLNTEPRPLTTVVPGCSRELSDLLVACLAKKPERRPDANDVVRRLEAMLSGTGSVIGQAPIRSEPSELPIFRGFVRELRQRHVFNVAAVYAAMTYGLLQVASLIVPELPLPPWSYTAVVAVTLAGFPVALVLAWAYDLTPDGVRRADRTSLSGKEKALRAAGLAVSLGLAALIGWWIIRG